MSLKEWCWCALATVAFLFVVGFTGAMLYQVFNIHN